MPVKFPGWSRAFWLALILFISAILTPMADRSIPHTPERPTTAQSAEGNSQAGSTGVAQDALMNSVREIPRVQVLSPAQMRKLELIATDPRLPQSMQADALKELQNAIGGIPESELTNYVRQLLETLRQLNAGKSENKTTGNIPGTSPDSANKTKISALLPAAEYKAFESVEKGWSSNEPRFADVKDALSRYYKSAKR